MVFNGGAGHDDAVLGIENARGFGGIAGGVFDSLGFVKDDGGKFEILEIDDVAAEGTVGGESDIVFADCSAKTGGAGVVKNLELGSEAAGFGFPVEEQGFGDDDEIGREFFAGGAAFAVELEEREHLDGFADAHIVSEAAAEADGFKEKQPGEAFALVGAHGADKAIGLGGRGEAGESAEAAAHLLKSLVGLDVLLFVEKRIQERGLRHAEAEDAVDFLAEIGERRVALDPLFRKQTDTAIAKADVARLVLHGGDEFWEMGVEAVETGGGVDFEPVDASCDFDLGEVGSADGLAFGEDFPILVDEGADGSGEARQGEVPDAPGGKGVDAGLEAEAAEKSAAGFVKSLIEEDDFGGVFGHVEVDVGIDRFGLAVTVIVDEHQRAFGGGALGIELQTEARRGPAADLFGLQLFREFPHWTAAETGDEAEEVRPIGARDEEGLTLRGLADPGVRRAGFEFGESVVEENDAEIEEGGFLYGHDPLAIHEVNGGFDPLCIFDFGAEADAPVVWAPGNGAPVFFGEGGAGEEAACLGEFAGEIGEAGPGEIEGGFEEIVEVVGAPGDRGGREGVRRGFRGRRCRGAGRCRSGGCERVWER